MQGGGAKVTPKYQCRGRWLAHSRARLTPLPQVATSVGTGSHTTALAFISFCQSRPSPRSSPSPDPPSVCAGGEGVAPLAPPELAPPGLAEAPELGPASPASLLMPASQMRLL